jgi:hypothetical protein
MIQVRLAMSLIGTDDRPPNREALEAYQQSLKIGQTLAEQDKTNAGWRRDLIVSFYKVGTITAKIGRNDNVAQAKEFFREALNVSDKYSGLDRQQLADALKPSFGANALADVIESRQRRRSRSGRKGGRPFIVCIQWRDSRWTMVLTPWGSGPKNRGMTWPEWSRERLICLVCRRCRPGLLIIETTLAEYLHHRGSKIGVLPRWPCGIQGFPCLTARSKQS